MYGSATSWVMLGIVFVVALVGKLREPRPIQTLASALAAIAPSGARTAAAAVIAAEAVVVAGLATGVIVPWAARLSAGLAAVLMSVFALAIGISLHRGVNARCRCFGTAGDALGWRHVVRNSIILVAAVIGAAAPPVRLSALEPAPALLACLAGGLAGLLIIQFDAIVELFLGPVGRTPQSIRE